MFKYLFVPALLVCFSVESASDENSRSTNKLEENEFLELSEPERKVSGAYYGAGIGLSRISNKLNVSKNGNPSVKYDNSATQFDLSAIIGFGSAFYERYYAGIELEFFKRLPEKTKRKDTEIGIIHAPSIGLNMDIRFGYQFPKQGTLAYVTVGFARIIGKAEFYHNDGNARNTKEQKINKTFGSFYPTVGIGIEYKMNHKWNIRGDIRYSITNKDDNKNIRFAGNSYKFDGKPNRIAFRLSITRTI